MKVIGLTGGTGSGKGTVSLCLQNRGAKIIDADHIAHQIIQKGEPAYQELVSYFGEGILDENGEIIRRSLGEIVFRDEEKLSFLNQCTHKYIVQEMKDNVHAAKEEIIVIDAPLLLEAKLEQLCDVVWVVYADEETRARRIMARDGITYETAKARICNQKSWEEYKKAAHMVIDNSNTAKVLEEQVLQYLERLQVKL